MKKPIELWNKYVQEELSFEYKHLSNDEFNEQTEDIKNAFEYAIEAAQPKWISVADELPKKEQRVIVFGNYEGQPYYDMLEHSSPSDFKVITHWMPLPSPPKTTDNDNP